MNRAFLIVAVVTALVGCRLQQVQEEPDVQSPQPEKTITGAEKYYCEIQRMLDSVEQNLPALAESADKAAALYVGNADYGIASDGYAPFLWEGVWRSGCLMAQDCFLPEGGKNWQGIMLYCLQPDSLQKDLEKIAEYNEYGIRVWLFATRRQVQQIQSAEVEVESIVVIPAAPENGLFPGPGDTPIVSTYEIASFSVLMPWIGEFTAACTRRGKMLTMFESIRKPNGQARIDKFKEVKFHDETPPAVDRLLIGRRWLAAARQRLAALHGTQMDKIKKAGELAAQALISGGELYVVSAGHGSAAATAGVPCDPGYFSNINGKWKTKVKYPEEHRDDLRIDADDLVLGIGYDEFFSGDGWAGFAEYVREAGAARVWSFATYREDQFSQVQKSELFIDPQWEYGDADVEFPGYDVKVLPTSGLLSTAIYEMINAEIYQHLQNYFENQGGFYPDDAQPKAGGEG